MKGEFVAGSLTILLTGAAGFIGSHVAEALILRGQRVVGLDNFDPFYPRGFKERNLEGLRRQAGFEMIEGDIRDQALLEQVCRERRIDAILHLAARAGVRPSVSQPMLYADVNVGGTAAVFEAARRTGVAKVVYASSSSVYGAGANPPFAEDGVVDRPLSPYAATKRANELQAETWHHLYGLDLIGLRFFTVYGPRQRPEMAIHRFTRLIDQGRPVPVFGDGGARRDFTFIDDIVQGVLGALDRAGGCRVFNLGESETTSVLQLIQLIAAQLGKPARIEHRPPEPGDVPLTCADVSRARAELGYAPKVPLARGIPLFVDWYRAEGRAQAELTEDA